MAQIVDNDQSTTNGAAGISTSTISAFTSSRSTNANGNGQQQRTKGGGRITVDGMKTYWNIRDWVAKFVAIYNKTMID